MAAFSNAIIFSCDSNIGVIDSFLLQHEVTFNAHDIRFDPKDRFPEREPIFIIKNGTLVPINMPTTIKPFIITIHDAQNIIDEHPDIFCLKNMKSVILSGSQNESNKIIHEKLGHAILPIDHCTHIKFNGKSIDLVSLFFNPIILAQLALYNKKKERVREFLSIPRNNRVTKTKFKYNKPKNDQYIVHQANMAYYGAEEEDPDIVYVSNNDFCNEHLSD